PQLYPLSLHDALPIYGRVDLRDLENLATHFGQSSTTFAQGDFDYDGLVNDVDLGILARNWQGSLSTPIPSLPTSTIVRKGPARSDRKSTRLNSSHVAI